MSEVHDTFADGALPRWNRFAVGHARVEEQRGVLRFVMGPAPADALSDAELNDHRLYERGKWLWRPPLRLTVRARASHLDGQLIGTTGFGFWNAPFATEGNALDSPQAVWFFYASPPSYLSMSPRGHGTGWRAQTLNVPRVPKIILLAGGIAWQALKPLRPFFYRAAQSQVGGGEILIHERLTDWHTYRIDWLKARVDFFVDDRKIYTSTSAPRGPLGFCAWLDNSMLNVRGDQFASGYVAVPERQWLELSEVTIETLPADA